MTQYDAASGGLDRRSGKDLNFSSGSVRGARDRVRRFRKFLSDKYWPCRLLQLDNRKGIFALLVSPCPDLIRTNLLLPIQSLWPNQLARATRIVVQHEQSTHQTAHQTTYQTNRRPAIDVWDTLFSSTTTLWLISFIILFFRMC